MHLDGTTLTVAAPFVSAALSFLAIQRSVRRQIRATVDERRDADVAEHRRWTRDRVVDVYLDLLVYLGDVDKARST